jgi:hypothetical protein
MKTIFRFFLLLFVLLTSLDASKAPAIRGIGGTEYLLPNTEWLVRLFEQDDQTGKTDMENPGFVATLLLVSNPNHV